MWAHHDYCGRSTCEGRFPEHETNAPDISEHDASHNPMMAVRHLQSHVCWRLRLCQTFDTAIRSGDLQTAYHLYSRHLHTTASVLTSNSKSEDPLRRKRTKKSNSLKKTDKPSTPKRIKRSKALVVADSVTDRFDYSRKITKLIEDDKRKNSLLAKTMKELLDAIANSREQLPHIEPWFWKLVEGGQERQLLVDCAMDGFQKAGTFMLLADGKFTLDQLVKDAPNAKASSSQGVYARVYVVGERMTFFELCKFLDGRKLPREKEKELNEKRRSLAAKRTSSLYIGSSHHMGSRMRGHDHFLPKQHTYHAYAYDNADRKYSRVLCDLSDNVYAQRDEHIRLVVEQLLVTLLGTYVWTPDDLTRHIKDQQSIQSSTTIAADEIIKMADIDTGDPAVHEVKNKRARSRLLRDRSTTTSMVLAKLGREVCTKCGWQPTTARSDSTQKFGSKTLPLNRNSPIDTIMNKPKKAKITECETTETTETSVYGKATSEVVEAAMGDTGSAGSSLSMSGNNQD